MQSGVQVAPGWHVQLEPQLQPAAQLAPGWHVHTGAHWQAEPQAQDSALLSMATSAALEVESRLFTETFMGVLVHCCVDEQ